MATASIEDRPRRLLRASAEFDRGSTLRGRRPQPIALKILRGNPGRRPLPRQDLKPTRGTGPPKWLTTEARREWLRIYPELERLNLISELDRAALVCFVESWSDLRWAVETIRREGRMSIAGNSTPLQHPAMAIKRASMRAIREFAGEFGFTPASRGRVEFICPENDDPDYEKFFGPQATPSR